MINTIITNTGTITTKLRGRYTGIEDSMIGLKDEIIKNHQ